MLDDSVKEFLKKNKIQIKQPHSFSEISHNKSDIFGIKQLNKTNTHSYDLVKNRHTENSHEVSKLHPNVHSSVEPKQNHAKMEDKGRPNFLRSILHRQ